MASSEGTRPKLLTQVRVACRLRQLSRRTEQAYLSWVRRFVRFHRLRHPAETGEGEVLAYLEDLTVRGRVSHSRQMQALSALVFLYRDVLRRPLGDLRAVVRASGPRRLPAVLTQHEVARLLGQLEGDAWLVVAGTAQGPAGDASQTSQGTARPGRGRRRWPGRATGRARAQGAGVGGGVGVAVGVSGAAALPGPSDRRTSPAPSRPDRGAAGGGPCGASGGHQ